MNQEKPLPLKMDHLPSYFVKKALKELKETPERQSQELSKFKKLIDADESISGIDYETDFLIQFLRHGKYDTTKAFSRLKNFIEYKRKHPDLFASVPESYFYTKSRIMTVLPYRTPDGCAILYTRAGLWDPEEIPFEDLKRLLVMLFLQPLRDPMTQINGYKIIHDIEGTSFKHIKFCTPDNVYLLYYAVLQGIPARYKEIHVMNNTLTLKILWAIIKKLLPTKIRERCFFHSNDEDLLKHFPPSVLPAKYGGDLTTFVDEDLMKRLNKEYGACPLGGQSNYY